MDLRKSHAKFKLTNVNLGSAIYSESQSMRNVYRYAPHNDVSVNDELHMRQWSHKIILQYNIILLKYNIIILTIVLQ